MARPDPPVSAASDRSAARAGNAHRDEARADTSWRLAGLMIQFFWVLVLFIFGLYVFFAIFGAYDWVSLPSLLVLGAVLVFTVLARLVAGERRKGPRDARLAAARERRGF